jgi:hypothetical protein
VRCGDNGSKQRIVNPPAVIDAPEELLSIRERTNDSSAASQFPVRLSQLRVTFSFVVLRDGCV